MGVWWTLVKHLVVLVHIVWNPGTHWLYCLLNTGIPVVSTTKKCIISVVPTGIVCVLIKNSTKFLKYPGKRQIDAWGLFSGMWSGCGNRISTCLTLGLILLKRSLLSRLPSVGEEVGDVSYVISFVGSEDLPLSSPFGISNPESLVIGGATKCLIDKKWSMTWSIKCTH